MSATIVASGDAAPVLEAAEHVLDAVADPVDLVVVGVLDLAGLARWDARPDALVFERGAVAVAVVTAVSDENVGRWQRVEQEGGAGVVAHLTFGEQHGDGAALAIADRVQLGVQAALRAPDTAG